MKRRKTVSRTLEFILGIVGSVLGIFSGSFLIFLENYGQVHISFLGFNCYNVCHCWCGPY